MIRLKPRLKEKSLSCLSKQFLKKVQWKNHSFFSLILWKIRKKNLKDTNMSTGLELRTTLYSLFKWLECLRVKKVDSEIEGFLIQESSLLGSKIERKKIQCERKVYAKEKQFFQKRKFALCPHSSFFPIGRLENFDSFQNYKKARKNVLRPVKKKVRKAILLRLFRAFKRRKIAKGAKFLAGITTFQRWKRKNLLKPLKRKNLSKPLKRLKRLPTGTKIKISDKKGNFLKKKKSRRFRRKLFYLRLSMFRQESKKVKRYRFVSLFLRKRKTVFRTLCRIYSTEYVKFLRKVKKRRKILKRRIWRRKRKKKWRWRRIGVFKLFRVRYRLRNKFSIPTHFEVNYKTGNFLYLGFLDFHSLNLRLPFRLNLRRLVTFLSS